MRRGLKFVLTTAVLLCALPAAISAQPLGRRRFSLSEESYAAIRGLPIPVRSSSVEGLLVFDAGTPDPATGQAAVDLVGASAFIAIDLPDTQQALCLRPLSELFPVREAGSLACAGGVDAGFRLTQDHRIGAVGACWNGARDGQACAATSDCAPPGDCNADGVVGVDELLRQTRIALALAPVAGCRAGDPNEDGIVSIDELVRALSHAFGGPTKCFAAADCAALGGSLDAVPGHAGVCNGPIQSAPGGGDSGRGSLVIAVPFEVVSESALPCGDEPEAVGQQASLLLTTGVSAARILHVNDSDRTLSEELVGENFSCADWTRENGPGTLRFAAPVIDTPGGASGLYLDIVNVFSFDD